MSPARQRPGHPDPAPLTLADLEPGQPARVARLSAVGAPGQRMMQLGLLPGGQVEVVRRAPTGDPLEIKVLGYSLSLRRNEARLIEVEKLT